MIISLVNPKGGNGKSTLALCIAFSSAIQKHFNKPALLEFDPQGTLKDWFKQHKDSVKDKVLFYDIQDIDFDKMTSQIENISQNHDVLILDTAGESIAKNITQFALAISDMVITPMRTSTNDEYSLARNLLPLIQHIIENQKENKFYVLPSFIHPQTKAENVKEYFKSILPDFVNCFSSVLRTRSVFENFNRNGLTLYEYSKVVKSNKRDFAQVKKAIIDIENIAKEIIGELSNGIA